MIKLKFKLQSNCGKSVVFIEVFQKQAKIDQK